MTSRRRAWSVFVAASAFTACGGPEGSVRVAIPPGSSLRVAAESLGRAGVVRSPALFRYYVDFEGGDRKVRAGTYVLPRHDPWSDVLNSLISGKGLVNLVTIPEGWTTATIESTLTRATSAAIESLDVAVRDTALLSRLMTPGPTLEGYLFPETYTFPDGAPARYLVKAMVHEFERRWKPDWNAQLQTLQMSRNEVITLASIIEKEAKLPEERAVISAVYHNRLRLGMPLQADPTIQFALGRHVTRVHDKDLAVDSRYNTYRWSGLPPGPIASPGSASIQAALYPADVPYLYFVAFPDGHHEFRKTLKEHQEAVRQARLARRAAERAAKLAAQGAKAPSGRGDTTKVRRGQRS